MINNFAGEYNFLSNFHSSVVYWNGIAFPTVEHAYQAAKSDQDAYHTAVLNAGTPGKAKRLGQMVELRDDWEVVKLYVMFDLVMQKFQNEELKQKLLATGLEHLEEGNHWGDRFWGTVNGKGLNHLGRILMVVREHLYRMECAKC